MNNLFPLLFSFLLIFSGLASSVSSQGLPTAMPEEVGLSAQRLERIDAFMQNAVAQHQIAGAVTLVARKGKVAHFKSHGMLDIENRQPMDNDAIFRLASMSKALTSVAVMILYEEGHFLLDDPIAKFIPEFKNPQVLMPGAAERTDSPGHTLVPANREITIRHLLNHTSGIPYGFLAGEHIAKLHTEAGVDKGGGLIQKEGTIGQVVKKLAGLPLVHHPGENWTYGMSTDVLGYFVEVVSGMPLDAFLRTRIFQPLGMADTGFYLSADRVSRLAAVYNPQQQGSLERYEEEPAGQIFTVNYPYHGPRSYFSGGGGLCSTAADYAQFCQMLLDGGQLNGHRLLSPKTVELMTTNSIGDLVIGVEGFPVRQFQGDKFGLGFGIREKGSPHSEIESPGMYTWGGFFNTHFWIDPAEEMVGVVMTQLSPIDPHFLVNFRVLAYQAIVE